jgi:quercetin dioxygenase-like cupin family protein
VAPEQIKWVDEPDGLGVQRAVVQGDPSKPGIYVIRVKFPPGVMSRNHFHKEDRHAVVLKGTWWTGTGEAFTPGNTVPLKTGSYMMHPAGAAHFDGAKDEEVILQLIGYGPSETTRLRPQEGLYGRSK